MSNHHSNIENLGIPDIKLAGLQIWTHSRKYPDRQDFWDGNWLETTIQCETDNAIVWLSGDFLRNTEIDDWLIATEKLNQTFTCEANLNPLEKQIRIKICPETHRRVSVKIDIYPSSGVQRHYFEFWLMQESLNELMDSCRKILEKFPIRGK